MATAAGTGAVGYTGDEAPATAGKLASPGAAAYDASGNLFVADAQNHVVREISNAGVITTIAGSGVEGYGGDGGAATAALLDTPTGVAVDSAGTLYIADSHNHCIRRVTSGIITTVAGTGKPGFSGDGGAATAAQLWLPTAVAVDSSRDIYIADTNNQRIREITGSTITTIAGNGEELFAGDGAAAISAVLDTPTGVAVDAIGNVYVADRHNQRVRMIAVDGKIATLAGSGAASFTGSFSGDGGPATSATMAKPNSVSVDPAGNVYIADTENQRIREVGGGVITTLMGSGQQGSAGEGNTLASTNLNAPKAVAVNASGDLTISDTLNQRLLESSYPQLVFSSAGVGLPAPSQGVTLFNTGTAAVTVTSSYSGDFTSVAGGTCSLPLIQLQAGASCTVTIAFRPLSVGSLSGSVTFGGVGVVPQSIFLSGMGVQTGANVSLSSSAATSQFGQAVTFSVYVAATGSVVPTGTVSVYDGGTLIGSAQTLVAGEASLTTTALSTGTHSITALYSGDSNFAASGAPAFVETTGIQTGTTVSLSPSAITSLFGQPVTLSVNVTSRVSVVPTGTVSVYDGGTLIGSAQTLVTGAASLTTTALSTGTHSITALYSGDRNFAANSSAALVETIVDFSFAPTGASGSGSTGSSGGSGSGGSGGSVQTVVPGQPATYEFSVQPIGGGLTIPVILSATGLPPGATVIFSPQVILVGASGTSFTMIIQTPSSVALLRHVRAGGAISLAGCLLFLPLSGRLRRKLCRPLALGVVLISSLAALTALMGCGTGSGFFGQSQQSYAVQVIGSVSGDTVLQHFATVTLVLE
jgi:sugar lactone lactonase YvrE